MLRLSLSIIKSSNYENKSIKLYAKSPLVINISRKCFKAYIPSGLSS